MQTIIFYKCTWWAQKSHLRSQDLFAHATDVYRAADIYRSQSMRWRCSLWSTVCFCHYCINSQPLMIIFRIALIFLFYVYLFLCQIIHFLSFYYFILIVSLNASFLVCKWSQAQRSKTTSFYNVLYTVKEKSENLLSLASGIARILIIIWYNSYLSYILLLNALKSTQTSHVYDISA